MVVATELSCLNSQILTQGMLINELAALSYFICMP